MPDAAAPSSIVKPADPPTDRNDHVLWLGLLLGPLAAFINTVCGYTIAHWVNQVGAKRTDYLLDVFDILLCVASFAIGYAAHRRYSGARQDEPLDGRRSFMANVAMLLAVLCLITILFQALNIVILHPSD